MRKIEAASDLRNALVPRGRKDALHALYIRCQASGSHVSIHGGAHRLGLEERLGGILYSLSIVAFSAWHSIIQAV